MFKDGVVHVPINVWFLLWTRVEVKKSKIRYTLNHQMEKEKWKAREEMAGYRQRDDMGSFVACIALRPPRSGGSRAKTKCRR